MYSIVLLTCNILSEHSLSEVDIFNLYNLNDHSPATLIWMVSFQVFQVSQIKNKSSFQFWKQENKYHFQPFKVNYY